MLRAFERKIIAPARACGMEFLAAELLGALSSHPQVARGPTLRTLEPAAHAAALAVSNAKRPPSPLEGALATAAQSAGSALAAGRPAARGPPVTGIDALSPALRRAEPVPPRTTTDSTSLSIDDKLSLAGRRRVEPNVGAPGALSAVEAEESVARAARVAELAGRQAPEAPEAPAVSRVSV